jgi:hypothetical protein
MWSEGTFFLPNMDEISLFLPDCNPETCTQMTATEQWIFLCAAHKTPKEVQSIYASY